MKLGSQIAVCSYGALLGVACTADPYVAPVAARACDEATSGRTMVVSPLDRERTGVVLITDERDDRLHDRRYETALASVGFSPTRVDISEVGTIDLAKLRVLVMPSDRAAVLSDDRVSAIAAAVEAGLCVYTEGDSPLTRALGITFEDPAVLVDAVLDAEHPEIAIRWASAQPISTMSAEGSQVYARGGEDERPLLISGERGRGRWLVAALPLDAEGGFGYARFPYFHEALVGAFDLTPRLSRPHLIAYLDWGSVFDQDPIAVADRLAEQGIREVHLSGWYRLERTRYFFEPFIAASHARGMLVFSWLELPMVSGDFWEEHPECRQRTATGAEAIVDWRRLIALEQPPCMAAAKVELEDLLTALPWDGVDVAELYFETPAGFDMPELFTPMSDWVRADYQSRAGIDPVDFFSVGGPHYREQDSDGFAAFLRYRKDLCLALNREVIEFVQELSIGPFPGLPSVMVTLVDTLIDTPMSDLIGIDAAQFVHLQGELDFDLNIEDPYTLWDDGPDRYRVIAERYRDVVAPGPRLSVDINIVERSTIDVPHTKQTGLEFLALLHESALHLDQTCIYSADTPYPYDFEYAAFALTGSARAQPLAVNRFVVDTPFTVVLRADTQGQEVHIDGHPWPCFAADGVLVPSGVHEVSLAPSRESRLHVSAFNGELGACRERAGAIEIEYDERRPVLVTLDARADRIELDGDRFDPPKSESCGRFTVLLPAGRHAVSFARP